MAMNVRQIGQFQDKAVVECWAIPISYFGKSDGIFLLYNCLWPLAFAKHT